MQQCWFLQWRKDRNQGIWAALEAPGDFAGSETLLVLIITQSSTLLATRTDRFPLQTTEFMVRYPQS